jgi:uncharacterized protein YfaT (DUF1175 family)
MCEMRYITSWVLAAMCAATCAVQATVRSVDETDRLAFQSWFTFLIDAQFERATDDVTDCASLVRHAYREALRAHSPEWYRNSRLPRAIAFPDVRHVPPAIGNAWPLFRVSRDPEQFAEFADAKTLVRMNTRSLGRDASAAQPGDLLYFRQEGAESPYHLMVVVGQSPFDAGRRDWVVYHTGPQGRAPGEVRKVSLVDLQQHPSARWRPIRSNPAFVGVFRLEILDRER